MTFYSNVVLKRKSDMARGKIIELNKIGEQICFLETMLELPPLLTRIIILCELDSCFEGLGSCKPALGVHNETSRLDI